MRALLLSLSLALAAPAHAQVFGPATPSLLGNGSAAAPSYSFAAAPTSGFYIANSDDIRGATIGADRMSLQSGGLFLLQDAAQYAIGSAADAKLFRDAAGIFAQRNAANAQTFRIYNTFTDASNYERVSLGWSGNVFSIKPEAAGTGTVRTVSITGVPRVLAKAASTNAAPLFTCAANTTVQTALTVAIPGNTIGATGALRITMHTGQSGAGTNTLVLSYGGTQIAPNLGIAGANGETGMQWTMFNRTTSAQNAWLDYIAQGGSTASQKGVDAAVDSTVSQNLVLTIQMSSAANSCALESYMIEVLP